jgi:hypothetical protein
LEISNIFSQKNFLILNNCIYVVKIKNKRKLKVYLKDYDSGLISQELAAKYLGITPKRFRQNAVYQEKTIFARCKIRIPHNTIHKVMLEFGFAHEQENKQKRRKPWIRYERKHSLSTVHIDWHESKVIKGMHLCSILNDASRKILAAGEFEPFVL